VFGRGRICRAEVFELRFDVKEEDAVEDCERKHIDEEEN
jgi:hypothetical protein